MTQSIGIVGLGLIGGSLGLDLVQAGYRVLGVTRRQATCQQAVELGAVHQASPNFELLQTADLVFVCTPIAAIEPTIDAMIPWLKPDAVVTDVGSVKAAIVAPATQRWPNFVGGHPMAGKATAGLGVAEAGLFVNCPYVLTPIDQTRESALAQVQAVIEPLRSRLYLCNPEQHDQAVAWISHLPVMVSSSLIQACGLEPDVATRQLAAALASSGFRDTSRVGGGVPELGVLMARFNSAALLQSLDAYQQSLEQLRQRIVAADWSGVEAYLTAAQQARPAYVEGNPPAQPEESATPNDG